MTKTTLIRRAREGDLPEVVRLWAIPDDGNLKDEKPGPTLDPGYLAAFRAIEHDPNNGLHVAEVDGQVAGAFQLTIIQHVAYRGGRVAQIENVIVEPGLRSKGVGAAMMSWAIAEAKADLTHQLAQEHGYPLKCEVEPAPGDHGGDE